MAGLFDKAEISLKCPNCGTETKQSIGRLKALDNFPCPGCGAVYDPTKLKASLREAEKTLAQFGNDLGQRR